MNSSELENNGWLDEINVTKFVKTIMSRYKALVNY